MAAWIPFTLERLFPNEMAQVASAITSAASVVADLLITIGTIIEIISTLLLGFVDIIAATLQALIDAIKNALRDLIATGFYVCFHYPSSWKLDDWEARKFLSPKRFVQDLAHSFDDGLDSERPQFSDDAYVAGLVLMLGAPTLADLWELLKAFLALFKWDFEMPPPSKPQENKAQPGDGLKPNWSSTNVGEWIPPLKTAVDEIIAFLDSLTVIPDLVALVRAFGEFVKRKGEKLKEFAEKLQALLTALATAIKQSGLWALPILGQGGNSLLKSALLSVSGVPEDPQTTSEKFEADLANTLGGMLDTIDAAAPDQSHLDPSNRDKPDPRTQQAFDDARDSLDGFQNGIDRPDVNGTDIVFGLDQIHAAKYSDAITAFMRELRKGETPQGPDGVHQYAGGMGALCYTTWDPQEDALVYLAIEKSDAPEFSACFRDLQSNAVVATWDFAPGFDNWADFFYSLLNTSAPKHCDALAQVQQGEDKIGAPNMDPADGNVGERLAEDLANALGGTIIDEDGNLGDRYGAADFPDFGGADAFAVGMMLVSGGPSEDAARVILDLFGIAPTITSTTEAAGRQAYDNAQGMDNIVDNFPDAYKEGV